MDSSNLLSVGSVVLLEGATRKVVIIGYAVIEEGSEKIWDYLGCAYPIGVVSSDSNLLFDRKQISEVVFKGYVDEEGKELLNDLEKSLRMVNNK